MADVNLEDLKLQLENNLIRIRNFSEFFKYNDVINKKIDELKEEQKLIDDKWKVNELRLTDLSEMLSKKMWINDADLEEKNKEFMNLLILFNEKENSKKKIDERISKLEDQVQKNNENVRLGIEALHMFMNDTEKANIDFLNSIGIEREFKEKPNYEINPDLYANKLGNIDVYFKRIEYVNSEKNRLEAKLSELEERWSEKKSRLKELYDIIKNKQNGFESYKSEYLNLLVIYSEYKAIKAKYTVALDKLNSMNEKMISNVTNAITTLSDILNKFEEANEIVFTNGQPLKTPEIRYEDIKFNTLPEDEREMVTVTVNLNNGKDQVKVKRPKGDLLDMGQNPEGPNGKIFAGWVVNNEPYDFSKPLTNDITIDATYKQLCNINLYDSKNKLIQTLVVPQGERIRGMENVEVPKRRFKDFEGWNVISEHEEINGLEYDFENSVVTGDLDLKASYTTNRKKVLAVAAGVATATLATLTDVALTKVAGPTNGIVSQGTALLNGMLTGATAIGLKKAKEPDYKKEYEVTGIKKAGLKLVNHFRNKENLRNWRNYFATSAALSAVSGLVQGIHGLTPEKPAPVEGNVGIFDPVEPDAKTEMFNGIDPNGTIYKDPYLQVPNGKPNMQYFGDNGAIVRYFDAAGKEITTNTPISSISEGPIKIVEVQPDGNIVDMGMMETFTSIKR